MDEMHLYVEMVTDGTVAERIRLTRQEPLVLESSEDDRVELTDGRQYRAFRCPVAEDYPSGTWLFVYYVWADDNGFTVELFDDPFEAVEAACLGWDIGADDEGEYLSGVRFMYAAKNEARIENRELIFYRESEGGTDVYAHITRRRVP